jgi:CHAD domain-containing protein
MIDVHREVERKYVVDDGFELPPLNELVSGPEGRPDAGVIPLAETAPVRQRLAATYFDTVDLRLATSGLTLRRRTGGEDAGWHLKVPAGADARSEVRLPLGRATRTVPARLQQMVWARSLGAELRPVAEIVTDRRVRRLVDVTGQMVAEVADDRVSARRLTPTAGLGDAAGAAMSWREIEVELGDGDVDLLAAIDARLRERGLHEAPNTSKLAQVLDLRPGDAPPKGKTAKLTVKSPAGQVLLIYIREQIGQIQAQDLPVRLDVPDSVHRMRVATRRLRSALTTFEPLFADDVVRPVRGELTWLARELGAARDAEVLRDRVRAAVEAECEIVDPGLPAAVADDELGLAHRAAYGRVLDELDGERYHGLLASLDELLTSPPLTKKAAARAGKTLPRLVARSYATVRRLVEQADAAASGDQRDHLLHDARKAAKRARYAGESVSKVFGKDAAAFAEAMEGVQEALGEHQDALLTRGWLRDLALHTSSSATAFLYGRLDAREEARATAAERLFAAAWKAAGRKSLHRWLH